MVQKENVYPVGAGPGDPDRLTRKALRFLAITRCRARLLPAVGMEAAE